MGTARQWTVGLAVAAFAMAVFTHLVILQRTPVTDDESTYLFAAQHLGDMRLWVTSPADKLFWDRAFMINDGRWYTQYFLGWPALLAPFTALGVSALANPIYFSLTIPACGACSRGSFPRSGPGRAPCCSCCRRWREWPPVP